MTHKLLLGLLFLSPVPLLAEAPVARMDPRHAEFLRDYCLECHDARKHKGDVRLDDLSLALDTMERADLWQKVLAQTNSGEMPPEEAKQPDKTRKIEFLADLAQTLAVARKTLGDSGARTVIRRLNKREYRNTIRDLLGVEIDVAQLPQDGGGGGSFDTASSTLTLSSDQFESYLALGKKAIEEALAVQKAGAGKLQKYHKEPEEVYNPYFSKIFKAREEAAAKYAQWTQAIDQLAASGEYEAKAEEIRKKSAGRKFYTEWDRLVGKPSAKEFGFKDGQDLDFWGVSVASKLVPAFRDYFDRPATDRGVYLCSFDIHSVETYTVPDRWPPGDYVYRYRIAAAEDAPPERRFVQFGIHRGGPDNFDLMSTHEVTGTLENPQILEVRVSIGSGKSRAYSLREKRRIRRGTEIAEYSRSFQKTGHAPIPAIWVDWCEIEGPLPRDPGESQPVSLIAPAEDSSGAREVIQRLATRAFRGIAPQPEFIDRLVKAFESHVARGDSYEAAVTRSLSVVLASPTFLYLVEPENLAKSDPHPDVSLANRLAYFLWSAPPDEELLKVAQTGGLSTPGGLSAQVDRLLSSNRFDAFVRGFLHQWLDMDRLDFFEFDTEKHHPFDDSAKEAARWEVYETFLHALRNKGSLRDLLSSQHVVINGLLASLYGIEGVHGDAFRRVELPAGSPRGGLLGMAATHAMGSNGTDSSPIHRGVWVARHLLNEPPPPPPANVAQIARLEKQLLTARERVAAHSEDAQCASCHRRFDGIGFGLENFDAMGRWRTRDSYEKKGIGKREWEIDPSGRLFRGAEFHDYFELRNLIAARVDSFARYFTEGLLAYALGRPVSFVDEPLIESILAQARDGNYEVRQFFQAVALSPAFHAPHSSGPKSAQNTVR